MKILQLADMRSALFIVMAYNTIYTATCEDNETETAKTQELLEAAVTTVTSLVSAAHDQDVSIKAQDAIKILEADNSTLTEEREALIKQLKSLMEEYNVTEFYIASNQSGAVNISSGVSGNSLNILRRQEVTGYEQLKDFIVSHWSFTTTTSPAKMEAEAALQSIKDGFKFREKFLKKYKIDLEKPVPYFD